MLDILAITLPIYITIFLGFMTTRMGLFAKADMRVFGKFVINLALPALLFNALAQRRIGEILNLGYLAVYLIGSLSVLAVGYVRCRRFKGMSVTSSAVHVMGISCSNSGFIGYPILLLTLAPVAGVVLALNMIVENVVVIPLLLALAERGRGGAGRWNQVIAQSLARLAKNPMIIGLLAGLTVSVLGWTVPAPLTRTVNLFAMASGALSLFVIGGALVGLPLRAMGLQVVPIAIGKLVLHPLAVLLALLLVAFLLPLLGLPALDVELGMAAVLMAAMPMMSIYPILAQAYGEEDFAATALLVTTIASFFTLSGVLWILRQMPA